MIKISSHVLDSVIGDHAAYIAVSCYLTDSDNNRQQLFNVIASEHGRIEEQVIWVENAQYELVFQCAEYFESRNASAEDESNSLSVTVDTLQEIVVRLELNETSDRCHVPIMMSPQAYSVWVSG